MKKLLTAFAAIALTGLTAGMCSQGNPAVDTGVVNKVVDDVNLICHHAPDYQNIVEIVSAAANAGVTVVVSPIVGAATGTGVMTAYTLALKVCKIIAPPEVVALAPQTLLGDTKMRAFSTPSTAIHDDKLWGVTVKPGVKVTP